MRYISKEVREDLRKKMVFISGPRQCGKTTLAKDLLKGTDGAYFNWDYDEHRRQILKRSWHASQRLLVFDELHKFPRWKNWLKGVYDVEGENHGILVTGSARLDVYRRGGDSLLGRFHAWRLHPFTLSELPVRMRPDEAFRRLMTVGGFPEPFLDGSERAARRWRNERLQRVLRDDVRDLEPIREIQNLTLLVDALRARVGSPVVVSNLARDLQVAPNTVKHWLEVLERMCLIFVVRPLTRNIARAIQKPPKVYFYDNGDVLGDEGARFENLVATHLLKRIQYREDRDGFRSELNYVRDKEGREVDFAIVEEGRVTELWEAKWSDAEPARALRYYAERLQPRRATQVVGTLRSKQGRGNLHIEPPDVALQRG